MRPVERLFGRRRNPPNKKALRYGRASGRGAGPAYLTLVARLNFVVNFSTRPAVSTRRFSPV